MGRGATVYAEQLSFYAYGHPLWIPEPITLGGKEYEVQIGDVGYITEDGAFRRLFNITLGVPEVFERLQLKHNESTSVIEQFLNPGPLCSKTVKNSLMQGHVGGGVATMGGAGCSYSFTCKKNEGAMLILMDYAKKATLGLDRRLAQHMLEDHESWYNYARDHHGLSCRQEDLILVSGTVKTTAWAVAAFFDAGSSTHEVQFDGQFGQVASVGLKCSQQRERFCSFEQRFGPSDRSSNWDVQAPSNEDPDAMEVGYEVDDPRPIDPKRRQNQCIKHRGIPWFKTIRAKADTPDPSRDRDDYAGVGVDVDDSTDDDELEFIGSVAAAYDPLDDVLDYILEHSTAEVAIASHDDLEELAGKTSHSPDLCQLLRDLMPAVVVDERMLGRLQTQGSSTAPADKSGLATAKLDGCEGTDSSCKPADKPVLSALPLERHSYGREWLSLHGHDRFHNFLDYMYLDGFVGLIVPQKVHTPQPSYSPLPPVTFANLGKLGVRLGRDIDSCIDCLQEIVDMGGGDRATMRINWPGYSDWHYRFPLGSPTTRQELIRRTASVIDRFMMEMRHAHCTEPGWSLADISLDHIVLVELRHVSSSSWQPVLALDRP